MPPCIPQLPIPVARTGAAGSRVAGEPDRIPARAGKFKPEYLGQLGFYVALLDDTLRRTQHADTVGLLLVADKNDAVVRYSLAGQQTPIGVASYDLLPPAVRAALPSESDLAAALTTETESNPREGE